MRKLQRGMNLLTFFICMSMALAGKLGFNIKPSALQLLMISETFDNPILSDGPTGPVLRVATTDCRAG